MNLKKLFRKFSYWFSGLVAGPDGHTTKDEKPFNPSAFGIPDFAATWFRLPEPNGLKVAGASVRGRGHVIAGEARQDAFSIFLTENYVVAAIMDGVSSSPYSHIAANYVAQELEGHIYNLIEPTLVTSAIEWLKINRSISKKLVQNYTTKLAKAELEFPTDINLLREAAADHYATTLEIVVVEKLAQAGGERKYLFVNVSGDGALFVVRKNEMDLIWPAGEGDSRSKGPVSALPATDELPRMLEGVLKDHEYLAVCTDGVGDYILTSPEWQKRIVTLCFDETGVFENLLKSVTINTPDAYDDQTLVILGN